MTRHLLRLLWNRRRANTLIGIEILLAFLVLVVAATIAVYLWNNYRQPLGYDYHDVCAVRVSLEVPGQDGPPPEDVVAALRERIFTNLELIRQMPDVMAASTIGDAPYAYSGWQATTEVGGRTYSYGANRASDDFATVVRLTVTRGRWFGPDDDGAVWDPIVINERLAAEMFPGQDPVGKLIQPDVPKVPQRRPQLAMRVVGVIQDYRKDGEFSAPMNWMFFRGTRNEASRGPGVPKNYIVRTRPGTGAEFEARLVTMLNAAAPDWTFKVIPLDLARHARLREDMPTLVAGALVAGFLLAMVLLGLSGVLWLAVTERTREFGLRRAKGAAAATIRRQIRGEMFVLTAGAVLLGSGVVVQLPALDVLDDLTWRVWLAGFCIATACILALTLGCAWFPSRLATSVDPAEALRYE